MGKQPAVVIIARHGARLDAADKSWHLTSPTPYDPPLTYGGWSQSRSLGLRIASLLQSREDELNTTEAHAANGPATNGTHTSTRKRKHKVIVHCSPFLRCIETSIGISAGISQFARFAAGRESNKSRTRVLEPASHSPRLHAVDTDAAHVALRAHLRREDGPSTQAQKATLRVDAFLGEWLSPDYFDLITPPPNSVMMVAGAKADLLRKTDSLDAFTPSTPTLANHASHGNLWTGDRAGADTSSDAAAFDMKSLASTLPARDRTTSYSSGHISTFGRPSLQARNASGESADGYTPPMPSYAVSPLDPIPKGYVAHARQACVDVDFAWDSMREPLLWGDGGAYGEEWSAMHKRFRSGLQKLLGWYGENGTGTPADEQEAVSDASRGDDDSDLVVVLVTHGAGCNALIGALTEQPVLIDVGMASLTMAVRRQTTEPARRNSLSPVQIATPESSPELDRKRRNHSLKTGLSDQFDMKIIASAEHLRPGADPTRTSPSLSASPSMASHRTGGEVRRRTTLAAHGAAGSRIDTTWNATEHSRGSANAALGSMRRQSVQSIPSQRAESPSSVNSMSGLWSPTTPPLGQDKERLNVQVRKRSQENSIAAKQATANVSNELGINIAARSEASDSPVRPHMVSDTAFTESPSRESRDSLTDLPTSASQPPIAIGRTLSQKGLWGSAPTGYQERDRRPKRRWTLQQE